MLQLRKMTQPLLNAIGLEDLHVEIIEGSLAIVGSCGKVLVSITGISFSSRKPSNADREYATELFEAFLLKHGEALKAFVMEAKAFAEIPLPVLPEGMTYSTANGKPVCAMKMDAGIGLGKVSVSIGADFIHIPSTLTMEALANITPEFCAPAIVYLNSYAVYSSKSASVWALRTKIQSCSI